LQAAIQEAAKLLAKSRCPVFSLESDVHGCRSLIALAERVGATYDHVNGRELVHEVALHTDIGGFFTTATEARRRADLIVLVGEMPAEHGELILSLADSEPDLPRRSTRRWYQIRGREGAADGALPRRMKAVEAGSPDLPIDVVLGIFRAALASRRATREIANMDVLAAAIAKANFPVFVFSRLGDATTLAMLQGILTDLNRTQRATALFLPFDNDAWGMVLASTWMTGFPPRTGFSTGAPVYDPWLCDIDRMIAEKEADLHLWVSERDDARPRERRGPPLIALARGERPIAGAAVAIRIGRAGLDHDGVVYSSRIGTLRSVAAEVASNLPSVSTIVTELGRALPGEDVVPC
jgi:formylmethanofuran dehydrogenase subunit B